MEISPSQEMLPCTLTLDISTSIKNFKEKNHYMFGSLLLVQLNLEIMHNKGQGIIKDPSAMNKIDRLK